MDKIPQDSFEDALLEAIDTFYYPDVEDADSLSLAERFHIAKNNCERLIELSKDNVEANEHGVKRYKFLWRFEDVSSVFLDLVNERHEKCEDTSWGNLICQAHYAGAVANQELVLKNTLDVAGQLAKLTECLPIDILLYITVTFAHGGVKYGVGNWRQGISLDDTMNHAIAHLYSAFSLPVNSGRYHEELSHAFTNLFMIWWTAAYQPSTLLTTNSSDTNNQ